MIAGSWGFGVAAVALSVYAFVRRVPAGLMSDRLGTATQVLGGSLAAVIVTAVVLSAGGLAALAGRAVAEKAAWALTIIAALTSFVFLNSLLRRGTEAVSGPGARPVVTLVQLSWLLLAIAAVLLVAGAVLVQHQKLQTPRPVKWRELFAVGAVVALVAGVGVVALTQQGAPRVSTAAAIAVPDVPTTVGTDTAYNLNTEYVNWLVPAGPGFALINGGALTAYNGADGSKRWHFRLTSFPQGCGLSAIRSTGTASEAVVIAECTHDAGYGKPRTDPFLVGLDAMTGRLLWTMDKGWSLRSRILLPENAVPVVNTERNELGSLDPRTGALRWTWSFEDSDGKCSGGGYVGALDGAVMYARPCGPLLRVYVFDAVSGEQRVFDGPLPQDFSDGRWVVEPHAVDGSVAVVTVRTGVSGRGPAVLSIDTAGGRVEILPVKYLSDGNSGRIEQYPGPVLQLDEGSRPENWVDLYRLADRSTIHVAGLHMFTLPPYAPHTSTAWAEVGTAMVTAAAVDDEYNNLLVSVSRDGSFTQRPSPCGDDVGGVMAVPGAVLALCQRSEGDKMLGYDIVGLR
ncbi:hypothetical protein ACPCIR_00800 [Mycobacterium sp. NPDC051198]